MAYRYARIKDGKVINVEIWELELSEMSQFLNQDESFVQIENNSNVSIGYEYSDSQFSPPSQPINTVPVPEFVGPAQIRLVLNSLGITEATISGLIDELSEPEKSNARILWEYSSQFYRNNPFVIQIGAALGFSSEQIDDIFRTAITL